MCAFGRRTLRGGDSKPQSATHWIEASATSNMTRMLFLISSIPFRSLHTTPPPLLPQCCKDESAFECDAQSVKDRGGNAEVVPVVGADGEVRMARVPPGKQQAREGVPGGAAVHGGSVDARVAIKWQDENVPEKLMLGCAMELLEAVLE